MKFLSLNAAHGRGTSAHQIFLSTAVVRRNLDAIAQVINREEPDVVALQEIDDYSFWTPGISQIEYLQRCTGYENVVHGCHMQRMKLRYGTALLTKNPLIAYGSVTFATSRPLPPKGFVFGEMARGGECFTLCSVHLDFLSARQRLYEVECLIESISSRAAKHCIIMGDLNCDWNARDSALQILCRKLDLHPYEPNNPSLFTFPSFQKRWDWILVPTSFEFSSYYHLPEELSDHRAVVAELCVPREGGP